MPCKLAMPLPALFLGTLVAALAPAEAAERGQVRHIGVSASATVSAEPDVAQISLGVISEADSARDAMARNSATMRRLIDGLKSTGVDAKDIRTTTFNVEPRYDQPKDRRPPSINGYRVHNQVRITARDIARLGDVLDQAATLGANQIGSIAFDVSKSETLKDDARRAAFDNARRRALLFATAAGVELGPVLSIEEDVQMGGPRPPPFARTLAAEAVPIEPGSQTLTATVSVTFALK